MWERSNYKIYISFLRTFLVVLTALSFYGCSNQNLLEGLSQSQALEIVAFLTKNGIVAKTVKSDSSNLGTDSSKYNVLVKESDYAIAMVLMQENNLPRIEDPSLAETITQKGLLPNSKEIENLRVERAKAAELEETLKVIPFIQQVRAVVKSGANASASVIIKKKSEANLTTEQIIPIVERAVPGISPENIAVLIIDGSEEVFLKEIKGVKNSKDTTVSIPLVSFLGLFLIPEGDASGLSLFLFSIILVVGLLSGFVGYWFGFLHRTRQQLDEENLDMLLDETNLKTKKLPKDL